MRVGKETKRNNRSSAGLWPVPVFDSFPGDYHPMARPGKLLKFLTEVKADRLLSVEPALLRSAP
jgi:hypothetical protein